VNRAIFIAFAAACLLAGCQRAGEPASAAVPAQAPAAGTSVAHVDGIEWFDGDVDAAFARAAAEDKPVFLYWGAEWCPPCYDLKAHVFPRPDFQQSLKQFIAVYLDGDAPGAQRTAEAFRVQGYPSVVVLDPQRTELARISGGSDLASYAEVLDLALEQGRPVADLLAGLQSSAATRLTAAQCRRLAWNDWSMWSDDPAAIAAALQLAAERCPAGAKAERDRLVVNAADTAASAQLEDIQAGAAATPQLAALVRAVDEMLGDATRSREAGNALLYLGDDFFHVARQVAPERAPALLQRYSALLDAVEADERQSDTVRLLSAARRLQAARALGDTGQVPADAAVRARATLATFLSRDYDANARAGIVNSASWVLSELGDDMQLRALLEQQMKVSRTPYYYMPDMADIEERAGNFEQALQWLERGYRESRGPATRFQWGTMYVQGLLRMAPQDPARIRAAVTEVISELDGPDRVQGRARSRLARLDASLKEWAGTTGNEAVVKAVSEHWRAVCSRLPESDPGRPDCPRWLG
jgi:thiol-disulfide isomerase/thioredoxin